MKINIERGTMKPRLAITMGDPAGVGPEIIAKALHRKEILDLCSPVIVGSEHILQRAFSFIGKSFEYKAWEELPTHWEGIGLYKDESKIKHDLPIAAVDPVCGDCAFHWLDRAITWAKEQKVEAIVTAPLHKEALNQAGHHYAGHTEILAEKTNTQEYSLMLTAGRFHVAHVTCHLALSEVPSMLTQKRVGDVIRLFHHALKRLNDTPPKIAVCSLNPHGGEGGLFGREEIDVITPAVKTCAEEGILVYGPFPPDSIYPQMIGGKFDGVVAMYHDQGHIPFKLSNFSFNPDTQEWQQVTGVNVTLGLPIIRTSVDHGTAFDLAGTGKASERSLLDAIDVAIKLSSSD